MANVLFKKGLKANLPTSGTNDVVDGALYFAINDTSLGAEQRGKLYLGDANHNLIPIGEDIILKAVANMSALPTAADHIGEFYYIEDGNILAFSKKREGQAGADWVQVNTDTKLASDSAALTTGAVTNNAVEVDLAIKDTSQRATDDPLVSGSFTLKGGTNVTLTKDNGAIVISSKDDDIHYDLSAAAGSITSGADTIPTADLTLTSDPAGDNSTVRFVASSSVVPSVDASGNVSFAVDTSGVGSVTDLTGGNGQAGDDGVVPVGSENGFHMTVASTTDTFTGNINPLISVKNKAGNPMTATAFINGTNALDVYSTAAVDALIQDAKETVDAMTYRGPAGSQAAIEDKISATNDALHNGDVFVANSNWANQLQGQDVKQGYLIIVQGPENDDGEIASAASITYTVIKANDTDTTYYVDASQSHKISIMDDVEDESVGSLTLGEGTAITLTDSGSGNDKTITINHGNARPANWEVTGTAQTQTAGSDLVVGVVTGVSVNAQGHVESVTTSQLTIRDSGVASNVYSVAVASNTATITNTITDDAGNEEADSFSIGSSGQTITVTATNEAINLDIVWGSF